VNPVGDNNPTQFRTLRPEQLSRLKDIDIQFKAIPTPYTIGNLIKDVKDIHPFVRPENEWKTVEGKDKAKFINFFIRRSSEDPTAFIDALDHNTHHKKGVLPEIRPATAVGVLRDESGNQIRNSVGQPVGIGLLGDSFHKKDKAGHIKPGRWSEQGEMIFDNKSKMIAGQKCDIASEKIPLTPTENGVDSEKFKEEMERRGGITHVEGQWMDKKQLHQKLINQGKKAVGLKPLGSSQKKTGGRTPGIPKNRFSDYVSAYLKNQCIPHNEAFMILDLKNPMRIGINTHSKKAVENSLLLYKNTVTALIKKGYPHLAKQVTLAIYNNRTSEVKTVHPNDLHYIYDYAPDIYTIDHDRIHPDEMNSRQNKCTKKRKPKDLFFNGSLGRIEHTKPHYFNHRHNAHHTTTAINLLTPPPPFKGLDTVSKTPEKRETLERVESINHLGQLILTCIRSIEKDNGHIERIIVSVILLRNFICNEFRTHPQKKFENRVK